MGFKSFFTCLFLLMFCMVSTLHASAPNQSQEQKVETIVREAVDLVKAKGESAFPEFRKKGSKWLGRDHYIFIFDEKGKELVNGGFPELEGKNLWNRKDASGWIVTLWPKPGQTKEIKCRVFLQGVTVGGKLLIVGAPLYME